MACHGIYSRPRKPPLCGECEQHFRVICDGHPTSPAVAKAKALVEKQESPTKSTSKFNLKILKSLTAKRTWVVGPDRKISLRTLDLRRKRLEEVPSSVLRMPDLQAVRLDCNPLLTDVTILEKMPSLRVVVLKNCNVTRLFVSGESSDSLLALELNNNPLLRDLSPLETFQRLQFLNIGHCGVVRLPKEIISLRKLRVLCVDDNPLMEPVLDITCLDRLQVLLMKNCNLTALPHWIFELKDLLYISVEHNRICHIGPSLSNLACLMVLSIYGNRCIKLSQKLAKCPNLKRINVDLQFCTKGLSTRLRTMVNVWKDIPSAWWKQI